MAVVLFLAFLSDNISPPSFFTHAINVPQDGWDELRKEFYEEVLRPLVKYLLHDVQHPAIVSALLWVFPLKRAFRAVSSEHR